MAKAKKSSERNINEMRKALQAARNNGNKSVVSKALCKSLGISDVYYNFYIGDIDKLYEAVSNYCRLKNSPDRKEAEMKKAYNTIFPLWKELLSTSEKEEFSKDLRASEHDVSNLVSFCQFFMNQQNNVDNEEDFVATKAWAIRTPKEFRKHVEIMLGIMIAGIDVLSDEMRDYLREESKLLRSIAKTKDRIEELTATNIKLEKVLAKQKGKEAREYFEALIKDNNGIIQKMKGNAADLSNRLVELQANKPVENMPEVSATKEKASSSKEKAPAKKKASGKKSEPKEVSSKKKATEAESNEVFPKTEVKISA